MAGFNFIPRWLPIKSAAFYSAIGKDRLKELAESGEIVGFKDPTDRRGTWIFDRESLDKYRETQSGQAAIDAAVIDLKERLG